MDLKNLTTYARMSGSAVPKLFERYQSEFGEHASNNDPSLKQLMKKIMIVSVIFDSKLLSSFLLIVSIPLFSQVPTLQTKANSGNVENTELRFGLPRHGPFLTLSHLCLGFERYIGNHWARSADPPLCFKW